MLPDVAFKASEVITSEEFKLGSENNLSSATFSTVSLAHNKLSNLRRPWPLIVIVEICTIQMSIVCRERERV